MRTVIRFVTVISCVILLICSGCDTRTTQISQRTPMEGSTSDLAVSSPVSESSPTEKQALTQEIAESETPTAYTQKLEIETVEVLPQLPNTSEIAGTIVLGQTIGGSLSVVKTFYLLDMQSGEIIAHIQPNPPNYAIDNVAVSPDGKMLAYYSVASHPDHLIFINAEGQELLDVPIFNEEGEYLQNDLIPGEIEWAAFYWLDNERIVIEKYPYQRDNKGKRAVSAILFEPFQGTAQEFLPTYPDIFLFRDLYDSPRWRKLHYSKMIFEPGLTRLVYGTDDLNIVLWDLENEKEVLRLPEVPYDDSPGWSADGSSFLTTQEKGKAGSADLYQYTRDGEEIRLTYLEDKISDFRVRSMVWSPDGEKIAFLVSTEDPFCGGGYPDNYPGIIDLNNMQTVHLYCLHTYFNHFPVWSPDSSQLLLMHKGDSYVFATIVLDFEDSNAAILDTQVVPLGWMMSE